MKVFENRGNCIRINAIKGKDEVYDELREKLREVNVEPPARAHMTFIMGGPGAGKGT